MKTGSGTKIPEKFVVDASVAVKWFCQEAGSDIADYLLETSQKGDTEICAPSILGYEVGNALWKGKKLDKIALTRALNVLFSSSIEFVELEELLVETTVRFMITHDLTFYDASYGALAYLFHVPLITANPKDHQKVKEIQIINVAQM